MSGKTKLDRANWAKIQYQAGVPGSSTPGNIYINSSTGDLYIRLTLDTAWQLATGGGSDVQDWATGTAYAIRQEVMHLNLRFRCSSSHTSAGTAAGFFSTDLQYWECVSNEGQIVNQATHGFAAQDVIYYDDGTGWLQADASDGAKLSDPPTFVVGVGTNYFLMVQDGTITLTGHGLTPDEVYFQDPVTPGVLTATEPTNPAFYSCPIVRVRDANTLTVLPYRPAEAGLSGTSNTYLGLTDAPSSYTAYRIPYTNSGATALEDSDDFTYNDSTKYLTLKSTGSSNEPALDLHVWSNTVTAAPLVRIVHSEGTESVPLNTSSGSYLGKIELAGYTGSAVATGAYIRGVATQDYTTSALGTSLELKAVLQGTLSSYTSVILNDTGLTDGSISLSPQGSGEVAVRDSLGNLLARFYNAGGITLASYSNQDVNVSSPSDLILTHDSDGNSTGDFILKSNGNNVIQSFGATGDLTLQTYGTGSIQTQSIDSLAFLYDSAGTGSASVFSISRGSGSSAVLSCDINGGIEWDVPSGQDFAIDFADTGSVLDLQGGGIRLGDCTDTTAGNMRWNGSVFGAYDGSNWNEIWAYQSSKNRSGIWQDGTIIARVSDASFTVSDNTTNQEIFREGRPIRYADTPGSWRYGIVTGYSSGTVTLAGAAMTTSFDAFIQYAPANNAVVETFIVGGAFANATETSLLYADADTLHYWNYGHAHAVKFTVICKSADSGANDPRVNVTIGGNGVSTSNSNAGVECIETISATTTDINTTNYNILYGDRVEISTDDNGTNDDAEDLTVQVVFVLE